MQESVIVGGGLVARIHCILVSAIHVGRKLKVKVSVTILSAFIYFVYPCKSRGWGEWI